MQTNFAEFRDFSVLFDEISFEIRRIFETPIVSVKTKIRKAAQIFERNIAEMQRNLERNFEIAHRKFAAKIRLLNERSKTLFVDFHLLILPRLCLHAYDLVMTQMLVYQGNRCCACCSRKIQHNLRVETREQSCRTYRTTRARE